MRVIGAGLLPTQVQQPPTRGMLAAALLLLASRVGAFVQININGVVLTPASIGSMYRTGVNFSSMNIVADTASFWFADDMTGTSMQINGAEIEAGKDGASFYFDAAGNNGMAVDEVHVLRLTPDLAEISLIDNTGSPLRHEVHYIARTGMTGLYGYHILTAVANTSISEVRFVTRWDRCKLNHIFNEARGTSIIPDGYYLAIMPELQDSTWQVDGINRANLTCPNDNSGNIYPGEVDNPAGYVMSKYLWSVYHSENRLFGHHGSDPETGQSVGIFLTQLSGVTDTTSAASYGGGPLHQDLSVHYDAIICNYNHRNHYGSPGEFIPGPGWSRFFGPWLLFAVAMPNGTDSDSLMDYATSIASSEIASSIPALPWVADARYPNSTQRATVTGTVIVATDTRPADLLWVSLCIQPGAGNAYALTAPTWFVRTAPDGSFSIPGVPPDTYSLYIWASGGALVGISEYPGMEVGPGAVELGPLPILPPSYTYFLLGVGATDGEGGEFAWGNHSREWPLPTEVPGSLTFTVGSSWEPGDWYYAQTTGGTWSVVFHLSRAYTGTAHMTIAASMTEYYSPSIRVNGNTAGLVGWAPSGTDSTLSRQAVRSGYPRYTEVTFNASLLVVGTNTLEFYRLCCNLGPRVGMGWDALLLEVQSPGVVPTVPLLDLVSVAWAGPAPVPSGSAPLQWTLVVSNGAPTGSDGLARVIQLEAAVLAYADGTPAPSALVFVNGRDPNQFPLPVGEELLPGASLTYTGLQTAGFDCVSPGLGQPALMLTLTISANGRRALASTALPWPCASSTPTPSAGYTQTPSSSSSPSATPVSRSPSASPEPTRGLVCPVAGWTQPTGVTNRCFHALALPASSNWSAAQAACANAAPGARLAQTTSSSDSAFIVASTCGLGGAVSSMAVGVGDPNGTAKTSQSCCWSLAAPVVSAPAPNTSLVSVLSEQWTPAAYLLATHSLWHAGEPDNSGHCGNVWKSSSSDTPGLDDYSCSAAMVYACCEVPLALVSATPSSTLSPSASPIPTGMPTQTASGTATVSGSGTGSKTATDSGTGTATPTTTASQTKTATSSITGSRTGTPSLTGSYTSTASPTPPATVSPTHTGTAAPTASVSPSTTPTSSASHTAPVTPSASFTAAATPSLTSSASHSPTHSRTLTPSHTPRSLSASSTPSASASASASGSASGSTSGTTAVTHSRSRTPSHTHTRSGTTSSSASASVTASLSQTPSSSSTGTSSPSVSGTPSASLSGTGTLTSSPHSLSRTPSHTPTKSLSNSPTTSATHTQTRTSSGTHSSTKTASPTRSSTRSVTNSPTGSPVARSPSASRKPKRR